MLRITRPDLPRPYRAWGYPVTPLIFLSMTGVHDVLPHQRAPGAVAHRRADDGVGARTLLPVTGPGVPGCNTNVSLHKMLHRRMMITAVAGLLLVAAAPALAADAASPNDTARFLAGLPPAAESPLAPLTEDRAWQQHATTFNSTFERVDQSQLARIRTWSGSNLSRGASNPVLHVQRSGLPLRERILSQGQDLCAGWSRAGRRGAGYHQAPWLAGDGPFPAPDLAPLDPAVQLLHHQPDVVGSPSRTPHRHAAGPVRVPGALGQDHPRGHPCQPRRERCAAAGRRHHSAQSRHAA